MKKVRVSFIHCPNRTYSEMQNNGLIFMPVWAYTLAAHIPDDGRYSLSLYDVRINDIDSIEEADIFLFSGINQDYLDLSNMEANLRSRFPDAKLVVGGPIAWSFSQAGDIEKLFIFDHIFIGDGESRILGLLDDLAAKRPLDKVIQSSQRFEVLKARQLYRPMLGATIERYYGAVIEVSRGCPFLCEFCDIRVLPDNNKSHDLPIDLIIQEIEHICSLGVSTFLLACDNFISDLKWAEELVDRILEWRAKVSYKPVFYTWLTINLYKNPTLMSKMRRAGFDSLFIGVESFSSNSLLETAKVQNASAGVVEAIREIQSFGFPVVAGLIFGFDSDSHECFDNTLTGILESGLLSGDPSLLTALPGTPLFHRMSLAGRIRDAKYGLGGHKYHTNIKYLQPKERMVEGYIQFSHRLTEGSYQFSRLQAFYENLERKGNYIPIPAGGYFNLKLAINLIGRSPKAFMLTLKRVWAFVRKPSNIWYLMQALSFVASKKNIPRRFSYLNFWLAVWTTLIVKYGSIAKSDFDIDSLAPDEICPEAILPAGYENDYGEPIPSKKIKAQRKETIQSLRNLTNKIKTREKLYN
jgi:radical SAM superfamily enzyme YgiQ (UPF0313 family)